MTEERAILIPDWPQPDSGAPSPVTVADDSALFVRYLTDTGKIAVIHFPLCSIFTFGAPNDEVLAGHPLYGKVHGVNVHRFTSSPKFPTPTKLTQ